MLVINLEWQLKSLLCVTELGVVAFKLAFVRLVFPSFKKQKSKPGLLFLSIKKLLCLCMPCPWESGTQVSGRTGALILMLLAADGKLSPGSVRAELSSQCHQCLQAVPGAGLGFQPFPSAAVAQLLLPALLPACGWAYLLCAALLGGWWGSYQGIPDIRVVPCIPWLGRLLPFFKQNAWKLFVLLTIHKRISNVLFAV